MAFLGASWRSWADSGAILRPFGDHLGPFRAILGSWDHLGTVLGHLGPSWAILGPSWDSLGPEVWPEWLGPICPGSLAPHFGRIGPQKHEKTHVFEGFCKCTFFGTGAVLAGLETLGAAPSPSKSLQVPPSPSLCPGGSLGPASRARYS